MKTSCKQQKNFAKTALLMLMLCSFDATAPAQPVQVKEKKNPFTEEDLKIEKIKGGWRMGATPEQKQALDPSQPVVLKVLQIYSGRDKYIGHIKITEATIENRGPKTTKTLQLRWSVVNLSDPESVLLEGVMPTFEAEVQPYSSQELNIPPIHYNKILKPLSKEGALEGTLVLLVAIEGVSFTDGTAWRRAQPSAPTAKTSELRLS